MNDTTRYDPQYHCRKFIRLRGYDYTQVGAYYITICTKDKESMFGEIHDHQMVLNPSGQMIETVWQEIPLFYLGIEIDTYQIMPDHFHGIVIITLKPAPPVPKMPLSLADVVHRFKTMTTKKYSDGVKQNGWRPFSGKLWQANYYEHIIRNEDSHQIISQYILNNPRRFQDQGNRRGIPPWLP